MSFSPKEPVIVKLKYITGRGGDGISGLSAHLASLSDDYHVLALDQYF